MARGFTVKGRTFTVRDIPPWIQPLLTTYSSLLKACSTADEAVKASQEMEKIVNALFETIGLEPKPEAEEATPVLIEVMRIISASFEAHSFFREGSFEGSGKPSSNDSSASKPASRDGSP